MKIILAQGYIPHVVRAAERGRAQETRSAEGAAGWWRHAMGGSTNSRKLLVRYEKLEHTFLGSQPSGRPPSSPCKDQSTCSIFLHG